MNSQADVMEISQNHWPILIEGISPIVVAYKTEMKGGSWCLLEPAASVF